MKTTDTVVITGDHSWGRNIEDCSKDFAFIEALPGRKILLRGNHDMFWDAKKTEKLNGQFAGRLKYYPPTTIGEQESPFTLMAEEYGAEKVIYSHCHGKARYDDSFKGYVKGIEYKLVSGDYLKFKPELVLK